MKLITLNILYIKAINIRSKKVLNVDEQCISEKTSAVPQNKKIMGRENKHKSN